MICQFCRQLFTLCHCGNVPAGIGAIVKEGMKEKPTPNLVHVPITPAGMSKVYGPPAVTGGVTACPHGQAGFCFKCKGPQS